MSSAEANGNGAPPGALVIPNERVDVGWVRLPSGEVRATLTFSDPLGSRTHLLDAESVAIVAPELARLGRFIAAGLEPPPADNAGPMRP